jgi:hypothetical protein
MIQANELRIGNWIKHDPSYVENQNFIVSDIRTYREKTVNGIEIDDCLPIPLTEKILLKAGFIKKRISLTFNEFSFYNEDLENVYIDLDQGQCLSGICIKVKYLHQLQNLYFALTGIELQFKL